MRKVQFYKIDSGDCPVENVLNSLTGKKAQKVIWVLQLLEEIPIPPSQYCQKILNSDELWEISVHLGNEIIRIIGFEDEKYFILNHAFQNLSQKNQLLEEIKLAESRKQDYLNRKEIL